LIPVVQDGEKFAVFVASNVTVRDLTRDPLELGRRYWYTSGHGLQLDRMLLDWFGKRLIAEVSASKFCLLATAQTQDPNCLNIENTQLAERVRHAYYGVALQGVMPLGRSYIFTGSRSRGYEDIRTWERTVPLQSAAGRTSRVGVSEGTLRLAVDIAEGANDVQVNGISRLTRGLHALVVAMQDHLLDDRLHQYVRSLEALTKPRRGHATQDFATRCATFVRGDEATRSQQQQALSDIYEMRCAVEHLRDWTEPLGTASDVNVRRLAIIRLNQAELLAQQAYIRLLTSPSLREQFRADDKVDGFWSEPPGKRQEIWGSTVDLANYVDERTSRHVRGW
jgi:hypothetical protein